MVNLCLVVALAIALAGVCGADTTVTLLDSTDTVQYSIDGGAPVICGLNEICNFFVSREPDQIFAHPITFNIYDPDGVTISDTLQIFEAGSNVGIIFASDTEGVQLLPITGQTIIEDGTVQTAGTMPLADGSNLIVQFQSDVEASAVPEPRWGVVLMLSVPGIAGLAVKRRKLS